MKKMFFSLMVIMSFVSCEKNTNECLIPYLDLNEVVEVNEFHYYYNNNGDTIESWYVKSNRNCGSYGEGQCPIVSIDNNIIGYRYVWSAESCKIRCK